MIKGCLICEQPFIYVLALLMPYVNLKHLLIGVEGAKTPAGVAVSGDPAGGTTRRLPERPRKAKRLERKSTDNFKGSIFKIFTIFKFKGTILLPR